MRHLIEPCDVDKYARPCDMDDEIIARAIEEAELLDIKPKRVKWFTLVLTRRAQT